MSNLTLFKSMVQSILLFHRGPRYCRSHTNDDVVQWVTDPQCCVGCWAPSPRCWSGRWADTPPPPPGPGDCTPRSCSLRRSPRTAPRRRSTPARAPAPPARCAATRTGGSYTREPFLRRGLYSTCLWITEELCKHWIIRDRITIRMTRDLKWAWFSGPEAVSNWSGTMGLNNYSAI